MSLYHQTGYLSYHTTSSRFLGNWEDEFNQKIKNGTGFEITGIVKNIHNHNLIQASPKEKTHHFCCFTVEVQQCRKRHWENGEEIDTDRVLKSTTVSTGYLGRREKVQLDDPYSVQIENLAKLIGNGSALPKGYHDANLTNLHPKKLNYFEFWCDPKLFSSQKAQVGDKIRLKTKGDTIIVESFSSKTEATSTSSSSYRSNTTGTNYSGEDVLSGWTGKIQQRKEIPEPTKQDDENDDEWK